MSYTASRWEQFVDLAVVVVFLMLLLGVGYLLLPDPFVFSRDAKIVGAFLLILLLYSVALSGTVYNRTIVKYQRRLRRPR
jgi:hypothetical protein